MTKRLTLSLILILSAIVAVSCQRNTPVPTSTPDSSMYAVDPVFREFYNFLGGRAIIGPVISSAREVNGTIQQYTENGLMVFDPKAPANRRFQLGTLGKEMGVSWSGEKPIEIAEGFKPLYERLGGKNFVGQPITGWFFNAEKNRYEQYFETIGFMVGENTNGIPRLLPFGTMRCDQKCRNLESNEAIAEKVPDVLLTPPDPTATQPLMHEYSLQVWPSLPMAAADQEQEISANLQDNGNPVPGVEMELFLSRPDGTTQRFVFQETDQDGRTHLKIPAIPAADRTVIPYKVCLSTIQAGIRYCVRQSYLIWNRP